MDAVFDDPWTNALTEYLAARDYVRVCTLHNVLSVRHHVNDGIIEELALCECRRSNTIHQQLLIISDDVNRKCNIISQRNITFKKGPTKLRDSNSNQMIPIRFESD